VEYTLAACPIFRDHLREYAARAGTQTRYWWGNEVGRDKANCAGCGGREDDQRTAPVGSFAPNPFGLHDVHGNVWEWVEDCWHDSYEGAPVDGSAWTSGSCHKRVLRGGSWNREPRFIRAANRGRSGTGFRNRNYGFRVARTLN
jgi:formylglycine-generating enzyme required for sulfatase activity